MPNGARIFNICKPKKCALIYELFMNYSQCKGNEYELNYESLGAL